MGDVVVFWYPLDRSKSYIKRVIGLPGETVEIRKGRVFVNGKRLNETYVPPQYADYGDFGPIQVPEHSYFVMGDHRAMLQRFPNFRPGGKQLYLRESGFCLLADEPVRLSADRRRNTEVTQGRFH